MSLFTRFAEAYKRFTNGAEGAETPDVTRMQQIALGQAVVAVLIVFGFDVSADMEQLILLIAAALGLALPASDAVIRQGRAKAMPEIKQAQAEAAGRAAAPTLSVEERQRLIELHQRLAALHRGS